MEHGERVALVVGVFKPSDIGLFSAYQLGKLLLGKPSCRSGLGGLHHRYEWCVAA